MNATEAPASATLEYGDGRTAHVDYQLPELYRPLAAFATEDLADGYARGRGHPVAAIVGRG